MDIKIYRADERHREAINRLIRSVRIGSRITGPIKNFWIVRYGDRIVACAGLDFFNEGCVAILTYAAVEEGFRRKGVGSALVARRLNVAKKRGAKIAALVTMYYRFRFYKKRGFRTSPRAVLPENVKNYPMFTAKRYKKCAVMLRDL